EIEENGVYRRHGRGNLSVPCGIKGIEHHAYRRRNESGNRALARRKRKPEEACSGDAVVESERKGRAFGVRDGAFPGHPVSRTVGEAAGHVGPDPRVHPAERPGFEKEGVAWPKGG